LAISWRNRKNNRNRKKSPKSQKIAEIARNRRNRKKSPKSQEIAEIAKNRRNREKITERLVAITFTIEAILSCKFNMIIDRKDRLL
jgi:hypothetical protein